MRITLLCIVLGLSACATVTADSDQNIEVATTPVGAACSAANDKGHWELPATPGTLTVKRSFQPLSITCKSSAGSATTSLEGKTRGRAFGNILIGGVPALVDAYTGEGYEYEPNSVVLSLK